MENNDVIELLDILYNMVTEAWGVPLGNDKCIIERDKAIEIINEIKSRLPASVAEAKRLLAARDEFIGSAKRDAEGMRKSAEEYARKLIDEQEVVRAAQARSAEMISAAEARSAELRRVAMEYLDGRMREAEENLRSALAEVQGTHAQLVNAENAARFHEMPEQEEETEEATDDDFRGERDFF